MRDNTKILLTLIISLASIGSMYYYVGEREEKILDRGWQTFEQYMAYAQAHDLDGLSSLSHQLSDTCLDPEQRESCFALMDNVAGISNEFRREEFVNVRRDWRQIIISTDWMPAEDADVMSYYRSIIFLTRDFLGRPKMLSMSGPIQIVILEKKGKTPEQLEATFADMLTDTDNDGLDDQIEECSYSGAPSDCVTTDPNMRDSDGDGWWDSIETFLK